MTVFKKRFVVFILITVMLFGVFFTRHTVSGETVTGTSVSNAVTVSPDELIFTENFLEDKNSGYRAVFNEFSPAANTVKDGAWHMEGELATSQGLLCRSVGDFVALFQCNMRSRYDHYYIYYHSDTGWPGIGTSYIGFDCSSDNRYINVTLSAGGNAITDTSAKLRYGTDYTFELVSIGKTVSLYVWKSDSTPTLTPLITVNMPEYAAGDFFFYGYNANWNIKSISVYEPTVTPYTAGQLLYQTNRMTLNDGDIAYRNCFDVPSVLSSFGDFSGTFSQKNGRLHADGEAVASVGLTGCDFGDFMFTCDFECSSYWATHRFYFGVHEGWPDDKKLCLQLRHLPTDGSKMAATLSYENNTVSSDKMYFELGKVYNMALIAANKKLYFYAWQKTDTLPFEPLLTFDVSQIPVGDISLYTYQSDTAIDNISVYDLSEKIPEPVDEIRAATGLSVGWEQLMLSADDTDVTVLNEKTSDITVDDFIAVFRFGGGASSFKLKNGSESDGWNISRNDDKITVSAGARSSTVTADSPVYILYDHDADKNCLYLWRQGEKPDDSPILTWKSKFCAGHVELTGQSEFDLFRLYDTYILTHPTAAVPLQITSVTARNAYPSGLQLLCSAEENESRVIQGGTVLCALESAPYHGGLINDGDPGKTIVKTEQLSRQLAEVSYETVVTGDFENLILAVRAFVCISDENGVIHIVYSDKQTVITEWLGCRFNTFGDCNYDDCTDILDMIRLKKKISKQQYTEQGDYNADKKLDSIDMVAMKMILFEMDNRALIGKDTSEFSVDVENQHPKKICIPDNDMRLPAGRFLITEPLSIEGGALKGAGKDKTFLIADFPNKDEPIIYAGGTPQIEDLTICYRDGLVTGNEKSNERVGIYTTKVWPLQKGACIRNVAIKNVGTGILSDISRNGRECMAFSVEFSGIDITDFSFRGFDFVSQFRTGNIYSDIKISSGRYSCDSAFYFGYDNYDIEESEVTVDSLTVYDTVAKEPIVFGNARAMVAGTVTLDNVTASGGSYIVWDGSSGAVENVTLKDSALQGNLIKIGSTDFLGWSSLNYLRIGNLNIGNGTGTGNGFKLLSRASGNTDKYYITVENYEFSSSQADALLDKFPVSDNLTFVKKGAATNSSRLCPFYSKTKDEHGKILTWNGSSWQ